MSRQMFREMLWWSTTNGTAVANTTTETILMPNQTVFANYMQAGRVVTGECWAQIGATSTPTMTFALRWGGVSGTVLAQTAAATLAAVTAAIVHITFNIVTRADGASGSLLAFLMIDWGATIKSTNVPDLGGSAGATTPAAVTVDLTQDTALSLTAKWGTANSSNTITGMTYLGNSEN
jgi:hypothetical protein